MKALTISKYSDFTSATYLLGEGYLEIDFEPDHRKVIVYQKDLAKISRSYFQILLEDCYLAVKTLLERAFKRKKWVSKNYFELSSLINMYIHTNDYDDDEKRLDELELLHERIARVLKHYKRRPHKRIKKLDVKDDRSEAFIDNMNKAAIVINEELIVISKVHDRIQKIRKLIRYVTESITSTIHR
jgi:hypothetical protein